MVKTFSATISTNFLTLSLTYLGGCVDKFVLLKFSGCCWFLLCCDIFVRCSVFFWVRSHVNGQIEKDLNDAQYVPIRQTDTHTSTQMVCLSIVQCVRMDMEIRPRIYCAYNQVNVCASAFP